MTNQQPFKVLHILKGLGRGGAEMLVAECYPYASHADYQNSYAYFLPHKNQLVNVLQGRGAEVTCFPMRSRAGIVFSAWKLAKHVQKNSIDLIHAHMPIAGIVARIAGRIANRPVVYTEHNVISGYHPLIRFLAKSTWSMQKHVIAISQDVANALVEYKCDSVPIRTIVDGVDTERYSPQNNSRADVKERFSIPPTAPVVGTVCVFTDQKRLDIWLEAANRIHVVCPEARFLIVGDGPIRDRVHAYADNSGISQIVHFAGFQHDVRPFLSAMDVFVMSSAYEGFGLAPVEAMAMGVPVVSTNVTGIRTVIQSGIDGYLVPFDDAATHLADAVVGLLRDPQQRDLFSRNARTSVINRFSIDRVQREVEEVYAAVRGLPV